MSEPVNLADFFLGAAATGASIATWAAMDLLTGGRTPPKAALITGLAALAICYAISVWLRSNP